MTWCDPNYRLTETGHLQNQKSTPVRRRRQTMKIDNAIETRESINGPCGQKILPSTRAASGRISKRSTQEEKPRCKGTHVKVMQWNVALDEAKDLATQILDTLVQGVGGLASWTTMHIWWGQGRDACKTPPNIRAPIFSKTLVIKSIHLGWVKKRQ